MFGRDRPPAGSLRMRRARGAGCAQGRREEPGDPPCILPFKATIFLEDSRESDGHLRKEKVMSSTFTESSSAPVEAAAYGGLADAVGGIATIVLAILALAGVHREIILPIAVSVFGAALLIQGGTMLSEYASIIFPAGSTGAVSEQFGVGSLSTLFLVGVAGIVLGILALLGISPETL